MDNEDYGRYMEAQVSKMDAEKKDALINAIKMVFRTFVEDDTQGVLILMDKTNCLTTMGLNASYHESEGLMNIALSVFAEADMPAAQKTKH